VRGFCFNLPTGKPDSLQFTTPREAFAHQPGAVAGRPVEHHINRCIAGLYQRIDRRREHLIIGAGGILTAADAYKKIRLGATLLQLYTALIYCGPGVVKQIAQGLVTLLERDGYTHISQAIGTARIQDLDQS
jgi:dihydroorotate dehydrogenase (fumarate)/dihydroorotate dehydrogenase